MNLWLSQTHEKAGGMGIHAVRVKPEAAVLRMMTNFA